MIVMHGQKQYSRYVVSDHRRRRVCSETVEEQPLARIADCFGMYVKIDS
jgi:hypothetical protein